MVDYPRIIMRCHEIQTTLGTIDVPEFEAIPELGIAGALSESPMIRSERISGKLPEADFWNPMQGRSAPKGLNRLSTHHRSANSPVWPASVLTEA